VKWIKYVGPHDAVDVPRWQIGAAEREYRPIEVSDEAAEDLLTQPANWAKASKPRNVLGADDPVNADPLLTEPAAATDNSGQEG
jgi:hypothetical protein